MRSAGTPIEMRAAVLLVFWLAGCLDAGSRPPLSIEEGPTPVLDVLVTDDEFVPIAGAIVFVDGNETNHTTDPYGAIRLPLPAGAFVVKAWAPSYYRNLAEGDGANIGSVKVYVVLERRPPDMVLETNATARGLCFVGARSASGENGACLPSPQCLSSCPGAHPTVGLPLPEAFRNLTVRLSWESQSIPQNLAFVVRLNPPAPFATGAEALVLEGKSPILFRLAAADLGPDVVPGQATLRLTSVVPARPENWGPLPVVVNQPFVMQAHVVQLYEAPPSIPW